jgi:hypothetical protein
MPSIEKERESNKKNGKENEKINFIFFVCLLDFAVDFPFPHFDF